MCCPPGSEQRHTTCCGVHGLQARDPVLDGLTDGSNGQGLMLQIGYGACCAYEWQLCIRVRGCGRVVGASGQGGGGVDGCAADLRLVPARRSHLAHAACTLARAQRMVLLPCTGTRCNRCARGCAAEAGIFFCCACPCSRPGRAPVRPGLHTARSGRQDAAPGGFSVPKVMIICEACAALAF
jgi:hypothetical protein